jgi:ABC-2 type transport system permease protein
VGLGAGLAALWAVTAVLSVAIGSSAKVHFGVTNSLYLATCLVASAAMFLGIGALLSEMTANRHQANGVGAGVIGVAFMIRMVADSTSGLAWLRWATPLGWTEELHPLTGSRPLALLPIVALVVLTSVAAVVIATRRDLGASVLASRDSPAPHTALLGRPSGLTVRLVRPVAIGWAAGLALGGFVIGLVSKAAASAISGSSTVQQAINRLGGHGGGIKAYLGIAFGIGAALIGFAAAGQVNATRAEESSQHLDLLLVRPVSRSRWLVGRIAVAVGLVVVAGLLCGVGAWLGLLTQGGGVGLGSFLVAGLNLAPPALVVLGVGILAYGVRPRVASLVAYAVVGWSFLVQLIATLATNNRLLLDSSVLTHLAPVPAAAANWTAMGGLVLVGGLAAGAGVIGFGRRDLAGE